MSGLCCSTLRTWVSRGWISYGKPDGSERFGDNEDTWSVVNDDGEAIIADIHFCPYCGKPLPDSLEGIEIEKERDDEEA